MSVGLYLLPTHSGGSARHIWLRQTKYPDPRVVSFENAIVQLEKDLSG